MAGGWCAAGGGVGGVGRLGAAAPDFDLDPYPANGARDGTWNPGVLFARASDGGRAFVSAELGAMADAGRHLAVRGLRHASEVSDQSEMCRMIRTQLLCDYAKEASAYDHARHMHDPHVLHVPLEISGAISGATSGPV